MPIDRVKKQLRRQEGEFRDASIFLVGTEGEKTESIYLDAFGSSRVKVVTVVCDDGRSSPGGVLEKVKSAIKRYSFGAGDTFWLLVDRDAWGEKEFSLVFSECRKHGINLLTSNERFEVYLCYHFEEFPDSIEFSNGNYENFLREKLGSYSKAKYDASKLRPLANHACSACAAADTGGNELWPDAPNSRAYTLVQALLEKIAADPSVGR